MDAMSVCWCMGGRELLLLKVSDLCCYLERVSWPDEKLLARSERLSLGYSPWWVTPAPDAPWGALRWVEQGEMGFEIVDLGTLKLLEGAGYSAAEYVEDAVFSPDNRLIVGFSKDDEPYWASPDGDPSEERTPIARVGTLAIALVGEWDYLEVPVFVDIATETAIQEVAWPRHDEVRGTRFVGERHLEVRLPDGKPRILDIEALRTDPRWIAAKARRERAAEEERQADRDRRAAIQSHNDRAARMAELLFTTGLTCPHCKAGGRDIRYHPGTPEERALFVCPACGRSFGL